MHVGCFIDSGARASELRAAGVPVVRFPVTSFRSRSAIAGMAQLRTYVSRHQVRLLHAFDTPFNLFVTAASPLLRGCRILTSQRSYRTVFSRTEHRLLRLTDRFTDGVVVNCAAIREHLVEEGVAEAKIHLCYNALDASRFRPGKAPPPAGLNGASPVFATVAVLRPEKGIPTLLDAFAIVHRTYPKAGLLIIGSGPMRDELVAQTERLGLGGSVHFEPATAEVTRWLNSADAFVLPSYSEALSNALMEAMACGLAPVASRVGGNPELISEGQTGLLFPSGDAVALAESMKLLTSDSDLRARLGSAATDRIRAEFTLDRAAARMAEIYSRYL